MQNMQ